MALTSGTKLGPYEIQSPLGAGGMGEVYRAVDRRLDRTVAVKVLASHLSSSPELKQRMEREGRAISSLNHPNICQLYDIGSQNGTDYLVMEFLEGETLAERLRKGTVPLAEVFKIGIAVAEALAVAHRSGIVHRDLKPGNIMLTAGGAKLMDFGLAKPLGMQTAVASGSGTAPPSFTAAATLSGPSPLSPLTTAGSIVGTIQYMSPEQIEGKEADARSDIFAFGAVLYEMVAGKRPFSGKSQISLASSILESDPTPISGLKPNTPAGFEHVVTTCLQKNPEERYQSAQDIKLELQWIAAERPVTAVAATSPLPGKGERIGWAGRSGRGNAARRGCHGAKSSGSNSDSIYSGGHRSARKDDAQSCGRYCRTTGTFARRFVHRIHRERSGWQDHIVGASDKRAGASPGAGHGGRVVSVLVAGQPLRWIFRRQQAEDD